MIKSRSQSDALKKSNLMADHTAYSRPMMLSTQFQSVKSSMLTTTRKDLPSIKDDVRRINKGQNITAFRESIRLEEEGARRSDYFSLRKAGPLKMYPMVSQRSSHVSSEFKILDKLLQTRKQVGKETSKRSNPIRDNGVWRRDMMSSFYRQSFFQSLRRNPESIDL